jgi:hypothetical protein
MGRIYETKGSSPAKPFKAKSEREEDEEGKGICLRPCTASVISFYALAFSNLN